MQDVSATEIDLENLPFVSFDNRAELPRDSGVYFVVQKTCKDILYIGKAKNLKTRFDGHHKLLDMHKHGAEKILFLCLPIQSLKIERDLIRQFKPILNKMSLVEPLNRNRRFPIAIPVLNEVQLILLAHTRGISKVQAAQDLIVDAVSDPKVWDKVKVALQKEAALRKTPVNVLIEELIHAQRRT